MMVYSMSDEINITLNSLNVIDNKDARIGFVAWEATDLSASMKPAYQWKSNRLP
jgi:hypothetical protein